MSPSKGKESRKPPEGWDNYVSTFLENPDTCVYCGFQATSYEAWCQLVVDHFIPQSAGGEDNSANYVVSCYRCNQWKGDFDPGEGGYTHLPPGKKQREALIKNAKARIRKNERDQRRREFYQFIMRKTKGGKT